MREKLSFLLSYSSLSAASPPPQVMEAHQAKLRFFKASTCQQLLERLVGHFMLLSEEVGRQPVW